MKGSSFLARPVNDVLLQSSNMCRRWSIWNRLGRIPFLLVKDSGSCEAQKSREADTDEVCE